MKRKPSLLLWLLVAGIAAFSLNCHSDAVKLYATILGIYKGYATNLSTNSSSKKDLSMTITSQDNPIAGSYNLAGTAGGITGSVLGTVLNLTLKPTTTGTTYTFSGNATDDNTSIMGTMTGVESGTAVKYTVVVNK